MKMGIGVFFVLGLGVAQTLASDLTIEHLLRVVQERHMVLEQRKWVTNSFYIGQQDIDDYYLEETWDEYQAQPIDWHFGLSATPADGAANNLSLDQKLDLLNRASMEFNLLKYHYLNVEIDSQGQVIVTDEGFRSFTEQDLPAVTRITPSNYPQKMRELAQRLSRLKVCNWIVNYAGRQYSTQIPMAHDWYDGIEYKGDSQGWRYGDEPPVWWGPIFGMTDSTTSLNFSSGVLTGEIIPGFGNDPWIQDPDWEPQVPNENTVCARTSAFYGLMFSRPSKIANLSSVHSGPVYGRGHTIFKTGHIDVKVGASMPNGGRSGKVLVYQSAARPRDGGFFATGNFPSSNQEVFFSTFFNGTDSTSAFDGGSESPFGKRTWTLFGQGYTTDQSGVEVPDGAGLAQHDQQDINDQTHYAYSYVTAGATGQWKNPDLTANPDTYAFLKPLKLFGLDSQEPAYRDYMNWLYGEGNPDYQPDITGSSLFYTNEELADPNHIPRGRDATDILGSGSIFYALFSPDFQHIIEPAAFAHATRSSALEVGNVYCQLAYRPIVIPLGGGKSNRAAEAALVYYAEINSHMRWGSPRPALTYSDGHISGKQAILHVGRQYDTVTISGLASIGDPIFEGPREEFTFTKSQDGKEQRVLGGETLATIRHESGAVVVRLYPASQAGQQTVGSPIRTITLSDQTTEIDSVEVPDSDSRWFTNGHIPLYHREYNVVTDDATYQFSVDDQAAEEGVGVKWLWSLKVNGGTLKTETWSIDQAAFDASPILNDVVLEDGHLVSSRRVTFAPFDTPFAGMLRPKKVEIFPDGSAAQPKSTTLFSHHSSDIGELSSFWQLDDYVTRVAHTEVDRPFGDYVTQTSSNGYVIQSHVQGPWEITGALSGNILTYTGKFDGTVLSTQQSTYTALDSVTVARGPGNSSGGTLTTLKYYTNANTGGGAPWLLKSAVSTGNIGSCYSYSYVPSTGTLTTTTDEGVTNSAGTAVNSGRRTVTTTNAGGSIDSQSFSDKASGTELSTRTSSGQNWRGEAGTVAYNDGSNEHFTYWPDGRVQTYDDRDGLHHIFGWDAIGRSNGETHGEVEVTPARLGLQTTYTIAGSGLIFHTSQNTNLLGEPTGFSSDFGLGLSGTRTSSTAYSVTRDGRSIVVSLGSANGLFQQVGSGLGEKGSSFAYGVEDVGDQPCLAVTRAKLDGGNQSTGDATTTFYDYLGRVVRERVANPTGSGTVDYDVTYNPVSRTVTYTPPSPGLATVVQYDTAYETATIANGARQRKNINRVEAGKLVQELQVLDDSGGGTASWLSLKRKVETPNGASSALILLGNTNVQSTVSIQPPSNGTQAITFSGPFTVSGSMTLQQGNVQLCSMNRFGGTTAVVNALNAFGVADTSTLTIPGVGSVTQTLDDKFRVQSVAGAGHNVTDSYPVPTGGGFETTWTDSIAGTSGDAKASNIGDLTHLASWGRYTADLQTDYSAQGSSTTLTTAGGAHTTWNRNAAGAVSSVAYASGGGLAATYHADGSLNTFTNARGQTATMGYLNGLASGMSWSNSAAPSVNITRYDVGLPNTIADAEGTRQLTYHKLQSGTETHLSGILQGYQVGRSFDSLDRISGVTVKKNGAVLYTTGYGYNAHGLVNQVTSTALSGTYGYKAGTDRVETLNRNGKVSSYGYDGQLRLNSAATNGLATFNYGYIASPPRQNVTGFDNYTYGYDGNGQLKSAVGGGRSFQYDYDAIGRRSLGFQVNALNQITAQPNLAPKVAVSGTAAPLSKVSFKELQGTTVLVSGTVAKNSQGNFNFPYTFAPNNSAAPAARSLLLSGTLAGAGHAGSYATADLLYQQAVPPPNSAISYDGDGNAAADWQWDYTWDASNRLSHIARKTALVQAGMSDLQISFIYDNEGRRVKKTAVETPTVSGTNTPVSTTKATKFVWDGWELVAEEITEGAQTKRRFYSWGVDSSGTLQGAGGVGGLVSIYDEATGVTALPGYDGNGNVIGLIDGATGAVLAQFHYGPFGEPISRSGSRADLCSFGFATKYTDSETGLVYFGYRYYNPLSGSWLSRDPLGEEGGLNLYAYCGNDPVNRYDLLGLEWVNKEVRLGWFENSQYGSGHSFYYKRVWEDGPMTPEHLMQSLLKGLGEGALTATNKKVHEAEALPGLLAQLKAHPAEFLSALDIHSTHDVLVLIGKMAVGGPVEALQNGGGLAVQAHADWINPQRGPNYAVEEAAKHVGPEVASAVVTYFLKGAGNLATGAAKGTLPMGPGASNINELPSLIRAAGKYDAGPVGSVDEALTLARKAFPDAVHVPDALPGLRYPKPPSGVKQWFQVHPAEPGVNELPHVKYNDWTGGKKGTGGSWGHIFFED